jgi:hypothetical protein
MHVEIEGPAEGSLEARASLALKIVGVLALGGVMLAMFPPSTPVATLYIVMFNVASATLAAISLGVAVGLDRRRSWAVAAVRPLLVIVIASGVYTLVVWLGEGRIRVPIDVALATWALLGPADRKPIARQESRSILFMAAAVALSALMAFSKQLFGWGGTFDVHEPDLRASIAADCGSGGTGLPDRITLAYDWSWSSTGQMPSGTDIVVAGWTGSDAQGRPLYVIDQIPGTDSGVYPARTGEPSMAMADQVASTSQGSFRWAIELAKQRFAPGHIRLVLRLAREAPSDPTPLTVTASYVHLGIWHHAAAAVTCTW